MKTATLFKVWIALTIGWAMFLGPALLAGYRQEGAASLIVRRCVWLLVLSLASALVLHVLYRLGARLRSGEVDGGRVVDISTISILPGVAQGVAALGVTLVLGQLPRPACGGLVLGLLLTTVGAFFLPRETLRIELGRRRVWRGAHLLGYPFGKPSELLLPEEKPIRLEHLYRRGIVLLVGPVALASGLDHAEALRIGEEVGGLLGREVKDNTGLATEPSALVRGLGALSRLSGIALLVIVVGLGVTWMIPAGRSALCRIAVAPHTPFSNDFRIPALRVATVRYLAAHPSDENLLTLVRVLNTADPVRSPETFEAAVAELLALTGEESTIAEGDARAEAVGRINRWAARRLGKSLDAHDGVLGWYRVEVDKYRRALDVMAGEDVTAAALAWDVFGLGDLNHPEDFLWAAGPGLADRRPIHFVLRRAERLEAVPTRRDAYTGPVLADTVGEALALQLWQSDGVGDQAFPVDFWEWWAGYARAHHLPPGGPGER